MVLFPVCWYLKKKKPKKKGEDYCLELNFGGLETRIAYKKHKISEKEAKKWLEEIRKEKGKYMVFNNAFFKRNKLISAEIRKK